MASDIQTIIIDKSYAPSLAEAEVIAKRYIKVYTHRETINEWRFRNRPPTDFKADSFYTLNRNNGHVKILLGELK